MKQVAIAKETDITRESRGYKGIRTFNSTKLPASAGLLTQVSLLDELNFKTSLCLTLHYHTKWHLNVC